MQPVMATAPSSGIPAGGGLGRKSLSRAMFGEDMTNEDWRELLGSLGKFFREEAAEPEHAEGDDEKPHTEPHLKVGAKAGPWPPKQVAKVPGNGHEAVSHHVAVDPEQSLDEEPRTLYVHRPLKNAADVVEWARKAGFKKTLPPGDMHATVAFSKEPLAWPEAMKDGVTAMDASSETKLNSRSIEQLGDKGAAVLRFESPDLTKRWHQFRGAGASWDHDGYRPHVTISYEPGDLDLDAVEPYAGPLEFGPEEFAEVDSDWADKIKARQVDAADEETLPHAAGAVSITPQGEALFVKRCPGSDYPGTWCWPGGGLETGEDARTAAAREHAEETGRPMDPKDLLEHPLDRRTMDGVDFATYVAPTKSRYPVKLSDEHTEYKWAPLSKPPGPLHPGVEATLGRLAGLNPAESHQGEDAKPAEHVAMIEYNGDFDMAGLIKHLRSLGSMGASRNIVAMSGDDEPVKFNWDGDGADKILAAEIDGTDVLAEGAADAEFNESDHPRGTGGKFGNSGSSGKSGWSEREEADYGGRRTGEGRGGSGWSARELEDLGDEAADAADPFAGVDVDAEHDGPWLSCMSKNKPLMYRNKNVPAEVEIDGKTVDVDDMLLHHEVPERKDLEKLVEDFKTKFNREPDSDEAKAIYNTAHLRMGTPSERAHAEEIGVDWEKWSAWCRGIEAKIEKGPHDNQPADADVKPIPHGHGDLAATDSALRIAVDKKSVRSFDKDGRMHIEEANICKACVSPYRGKEIPGWEQLGLDPDKVYKLLRDPKEIEKAAESANGIQLLQQHVPVDVDDHRPFDIVGTVGSRVRWEHPFLKNSLHFWTRPSINDVETEEKMELSPGYHYDPDMTSGTYEGEDYDGVMREIVFNHLALVHEGRQGKDVVVGDSAMDYGPEWDRLERVLGELSETR